MLHALVLMYTLANVCTLGHASNTRVEPVSAVVRTGACAWRVHLRTWLAGAGQYGAVLGDFSNVPWLRQIGIRGPPIAELARNQRIRQQHPHGSLHGPWQSVAPSGAIKGRVRAGP